MMSMRSRYMKWSGGWDAREEARLCPNLTAVCREPFKRSIDGRGKPADELMPLWCRKKLEALPVSGIGALLHEAWAFVTPAQDIPADRCLATPLDVFRSLTLLHAGLLCGFNQ